MSSSSINSASDTPDMPQAPRMPPRRLNPLDVEAARRALRAPAAIPRVPPLSLAYLVPIPPPPRPFAVAAPAAESNSQPWPETRCKILFGLGILLCIGGFIMADRGSNKEERGSGLGAGFLGIIMVLVAACKHPTGDEIRRYNFS